MFSVSLDSSGQLRWERSWGVIRAGTAGGGSDQFSEYGWQEVNEAKEAAAAAEAALMKGYSLTALSRRLLERQDSWKTDMKSLFGRCVWPEVLRPGW